MDAFTVVQTFLFIGFTGVAIGSLVNYRRVNLGYPLSPIATATQVVSIGWVLCTLAVATVTVLVSAGLWLVALGFVALAAVAAGLVAGARLRMTAGTH